MKRSARLGLLVSLLATTGAAAGTKKPSPQEAVVASNTAFAVKLYQQLSTQPGNVFVSPYSLSSLLTITWAGARGGTASELARSLQLTGGASAVHAGYARLQKELMPDTPVPYQLSIANGIFVRQGLALNPEFQKVAQESYAAQVEPLDFTTQPEPSRKHINRWVANQTHNRIKDLLPPGLIGPNSQLILANAIYFKGAWLKPFDSRSTGPEPFTSLEGERFDAPTMRQWEVALPYVEHPDLQILALPYKGKALSMLVLLPRKPQGLKALERKLSPRQLMAWTRGLSPREVDVYLPKFKLKYEAQMTPPLQELGIKRAFRCEAADFSGLAQSKDLCLSAVVHKSFLEVNEEGSEAAAVSMAHLVTTSIKPPTPVFRADHPFLFAIRDDHSGSILFLGRLMDPRG